MQGKVVVRYEASPAAVRIVYSKTIMFRVSPAYSDISDAGDENIVNPKPKGEDKDPKKEELQSSLNYYQNQYGAYEQHQNIINSFTQLNR